jgi:hypothetical protein
LFSTNLHADCIHLNIHLIFQIFFSCNIGLVQGESSPFLYAMYVNDIEIELIKQGCQSYELTMLNLYLLMYAEYMYIDLIRFNSFPVTPHLANFNHNLK